MSELDRWDQIRNVSETVSRETFGALLGFERLFRHWNGRINLASSSTLADFWQRHILDSAQLLPLAPQKRSWLDIGSGGGLPGIVIGILLRDVAGGHITLIESNAKKASFLRTAARETGAPVEVICCRIENASIGFAPEVITARALAPLATLLDLVERWMADETVALFHKGRDYRQEIEESRHNWTCDLVEHRSIIAPDGVILEIRHPRRI